MSLPYCDFHFMTVVWNWMHSISKVSLYICVHVYLHVCTCIYIYITGNKLKKKFLMYDNLPEGKNKTLPRYLKKDKYMNNNVAVPNCTVFYT